MTAEPLPSDDRVRILVVEDDAAARVGFQQLLTSWGYAVEGSALGAMHHSDFRRLFEGTNSKRDEESWRSARAAGLDIPEQQDVMTYDEVELGEVESFLDYCQQCAPHLYATLSDA